MTFSIIGSVTLDAYCNEEKVNYASLSDCFSPFSNDFILSSNGISEYSDAHASVTGKAEETEIFEYLTGTMNLNQAAACGILANIQYESGFNPNALGDNGTSYGIRNYLKRNDMTQKNYVLTYMERAELRPDTAGRDKRGLCRNMKKSYLIYRRTK